MKQPTDRNTYDSSHVPPEDTSDFIGLNPEAGRMDLGGLFSNRFANVMPLYVSEKGATCLYTATRYGKRFILKGLKEEYRNDPILNIAMAKEFEIGISLDHPHIRRTISLETVEGPGQVMVLEYIDGRPLESMLRDEEISSAAARKIARQIAEALTYLHSRHAVHRDLKPANILITRRGDNVSIIDFNLSDSEDFIVLKNPAGSGKYIAPELLVQSAAPTPEADIYSLGVVASELAEASGDRRLASAARKCMDADPKRRTEGLKIIKEGLDTHPASGFLSDALHSAWLTYALLAICTSISAFIIYHYLH